jgi:hypothetical protein
MKKKSPKKIQTRKSAGMWEGIQARAPKLGSFFILFLKKIFRQRVICKL